MKKQKRSKKRRQKRRFSNLARIIFMILILVLIGDILGAMIYLRQSPEMHSDLMAYITTGNSMSFFQIFWQQFLYQLTIWSMGLTIVGIIVNLFFIFTRGLSAGFNLAILVQQDVSIGIIILWLLHYLFLLFITILSVYFSIRFAYLIVKNLIKKKYKLIKKHLRLYVMQLIFIVLLTMISSMLSAVVTPGIQAQLAEDAQLAEVSGVQEVNEYTQEIIESTITNDD